MPHTEKKAVGSTSSCPSTWRWPGPLGRALLCGTVCLIGVGAPPIRAFDGPGANGPKPVAGASEHVRGRVVFLQERLAKELGIGVVPEARQRVLGIETARGRWIPLIENARAEAFRLDRRLRGIDLELVIRRYERTPMVQLLRVFQWRDGKRFEVIYWCEVCAIATAKPGACACCQEEVELRRIPVPGK